MAQNITTNELAGGPVPAPTAERMSSVDSALDRLWHFLTSMKLAMVLMLVFAALGLVGTLVIQAPVGVMDDPQAKAEWLASIRPKFGGWTDLMDRLQFFEMFTSVWLRAVGALLAASLVACTVHRIPGTWRTMRHPHVTVGPAFFEHAPQHEAMTFHREPDRGPGRGHRGLQAPPLPDRHRGRRHGPPLRGPQQLGAVGGPGSPHQHRGDPGRRDGRLDVRLPRRAVHAGRGFHLGDPQAGRRDDHPQLVQGHLQHHHRRAARLRQRRDRAPRTARWRSPSTCSGSTSRSATRASRSTRPSSGRPRS